MVVCVGKCVFELGDSQNDEQQYSTLHFIGSTWQFLKKVQILSYIFFFRGSIYELKLQPILKTTEHQNFKYSELSQFIFLKVVRRSKRIKK